MRRDSQRLTDIEAALRWIIHASGSKTGAEFLADETLCLAVAQKLTIVGEAVARLSSDLKSRYPNVPWVDIIGLRNMLVHEYFGIHWPVVWQTASTDVPLLLEQISEIQIVERERA